ncbi:MAG: trehalose-phosphatase [Alphaproteobacteria bacterium]|nr:trehalose-phosphatase [Alphaproteobacteria bacterium]
MERAPGWRVPFDEMNRLPSPSDRWALFLDLDGTLLDLAARPDLVTAPPGLVAILRDIEAALAGALAIVSGRSLDQIDALLAPWRPVAAGEHGAYCRLISGQVESADPPLIPMAWRNALAALGVRFQGVLVEQKASAIAVHYRLAPAAAPALRAIMHDLVCERGDAFVLSAADMAWEIRPRGIDKGMAVRRLMRDPPMAGRVPVFIGDDVTDEDGIRAAHALGGLGIQVGTSFAEGAAGVRAWLSAVRTQLRSGGPP